MISAKGRTLGSLFKDVARSCIADGLFYSGIYHLWWRFAARGRCAVLMYHRILSKEEIGRTFSHNGIIVEKSIFEKHIRFLKKYANIISPGEFERHMKDGTQFRSRSCLITFDDGWVDNYTNALPILHKHNVPAVVFLSSDYIGSNRRFWREEMASILFNAYRRPRGRSMEIFNALQEAGVKSIGENGARSIIKEWVGLKKGASQNKIDSLLEKMRDEIDTGYARDSIDTFLDWSQVSEMADKGVMFGSHGTSHRILTCLPADEAAGEIGESLKVLEKRLPQRPRWFAYPNGDSNEEIVDLVRGTYRLAFGTKKGLVSPEQGTMDIRRINMHSDSTRSVPLLLLTILGPHTQSR